MFYKHFSALQRYLKVLGPVKEHANDRSVQKSLVSSNSLCARLRLKRGHGKFRTKTFPCARATLFFHSLPTLPGKPPICRLALVSFIEHIARKLLSGPEKQIDR